MLAYGRPIFLQQEEAYTTTHPQPLVYFVCKSMSFLFVSNQSFTWIHVSTTFMSIPHNMLGYSTCLVCVEPAIFGSRLFSCLLFNSFSYFFNRHSKMFHFDCMAIYYILDKFSRNGKERPHRIRIEVNKYVQTSRQNR